MNTLAALCTVVLLAFLQSGTCLSPIGGSKVLPVDPLRSSLDVLHEDANIDPTVPVSPHKELFEMAKRIALKKDSPEAREGYGGGYGGFRNNMDRFEYFTKQFMDLTIDISYSAVYLLQNYTRFVQNANNKYKIVFE